MQENYTTPALTNNHLIVYVSKDYDKYITASWKKLSVYWRPYTTSC